MRLWLDISVLVGSAIFGTYSWQSKGWRWEVLVSLGASSILAVMLIAVFLIIPPLVFRREPKLRDQYSLTFSEEGIHFNTAHIDSDLEWTLYTRALVDPNCYILYHSARHFTVIPKRVFQDIDQQSEFEHLLTRKIPNIVTRT